MSEHSQTTTKHVINETVNIFIKPNNFSHKLINPLEHTIKKVPQPF